jgi:hypothetical protein
MAHMNKGVAAVVASPVRVAVAVTVTVLATSNDIQGPTRLQLGSQ